MYHHVIGCYFKLNLKSLNHMMTCIKCLSIYVLKVDIYSFIVMCKLHVVMFDVLCFRVQRIVEQITVIE